jgi:hypothetical protein
MAKHPRHINTIGNQTGPLSDLRVKQSADLIVHEDCSVNLKGLFNYSADGTSANVERELRRLSKNLLEHWHKLKTCVVRHHGTIRTGWMHMSSKVRRDLLLKVRPDMPSSHGRDWEAFEKIGSQGLEDATIRDKYRGQFKFPHINLAALSFQDLLWVYMQARAYNLPEVFATADFYDIGHG